ncbi:MAG: hypothetical protein WA491_04405 [Candidatus Acidiferrum sp.]
MKILDVPQSGSVGARTSARNRSGQYVRQRAMPTQPRTVPQVAARSRFTTTSAAWRGLTAAQQAAWQAFALSFTVVNSIGTAINLTGTQVFVKVNAVNLLLGRSVVLVPPALPTFVACTVTALAVVSGTPAYTITGVTCAAGTTHMYFASPAMSPGVTFCAILRFIGGNATYTAGTFAGETMFAAKWGAPVAGKKYFLKVVQEQLGMQDNGTIFSAIAT